jgi:isopenicillin N synthase-like dioxygenase
MEILTIDYCKYDAGKQFVKSLHETGFAIIKNHPIKYALVKNIFTEWHEFFHSNNKFQYPYNKIKGDGYVGLDVSETAKGSTAADIKEFFQIYKPWGRYPKELSDHTLVYFEQSFNLAFNLLSWLDEFSPASVKFLFREKLVNMMSLEQTMLRVLHYPPLTGQENAAAIRAAAHEDINLITLLPASNAMGLQVKTKEGQWLDVGTQEGEIIINVGDMLQECSNYYYISTTHRVINPELHTANQSRLSMPLFIHPRSDVYLSEKYSTAKQYLTERLMELGLLN